MKAGAQTLSSEGGKVVKPVKDTREALEAARRLGSGVIIFLLLKKDLTWTKFTLYVQGNNIVKAQPYMPTEDEVKESLLALLIIPELKIPREERLQETVESAGLDLESLPEDVKRLIQLIPGIELFIPDKKLVEASTEETVIVPEEVTDEVIKMVEGIINELGAKGEIKVSGRSLYVVLSKKVPKSIAKKLEYVLKSRFGDLYEIKVVSK